MSNKAPSSQGWQLFYRGRKEEILRVINRIIILPLLKAINKSKLLMRRRKRRQHSLWCNFTTVCTLKAQCFNSRWLWILSMKSRLKTESRRSLQRWVLNWRALRRIWCRSNGLHCSFCWYYQSLRCQRGAYQLTFMIHRILRTNVRTIYTSILISISCHLGLLVGYICSRIVSWQRSSSCVSVLRRSLLV